MSRVINPNAPAKTRNRNMRTIAEILRRMSSKTTLDSESKDMTATIVYLLREIHDGVMISVTAWEKRGYWMKADRFIREWQWTSETAYNLEDVIRNDAWDLLPRLLGDLFPHTADIELKKLTRSPSIWQGGYQKLLEDTPSEPPW